MIKLKLVFTNNIFPSNPKTGKLGCIDLNLSLLHWSGLPLFGAKKDFKALTIIYGVIIWSLIRIPYQLFELHDIILASANFGDLTQNLCMSLLHFGESLKTLMIFSRLDDFFKIITTFRKMTMEYCKSEKQKKTFFEMEFENKLALSAYAGLVCLASTLAMVTVLLGPPNLVGHIFPYRVEVPDFIPMDFQRIYIPICIIVIGLQMVGIDYLNVAFINLTKSHLQMLKISFDELNEDITNPITVDPVQHLKCLIEHHTLILNVRGQIERFFKYPMLIQFAVSLLIIALTGFLAIVKSETSGLIIIYLYVFCILAELLVFCWFGSEVSEQNETLAFVGYKTSWYNFNSEYKKSLILFLMNAQRPFYFTAGDFLELNLSTLTTILSKSYSFVALLRQQYNG